MKFKLFSICSLIITCLLVTGCVGHKQAQDANNTLVSLSYAVSTNLPALKAASTKEVTAHKETRKTVRLLRDEYFQARVAHTKQQMDTYFQASLNDIDAVLLEKIDGVLTAWRSNQEGIEKAVDSLGKDMPARLSTLEKERDAAFAELGKYPSDFSRQSKYEQAVGNYAKTAAQIRQTEYKAYMKATAALSEEAKVAVQNLQQIAKRQRESTKKNYERALPTLPGDATKLDLGPEPEENADAYNAIKDYTEYVQKVGAANTNFFISNSFAVGSYFDGFLKASLHGFLDGVIKPSSVAGIKFEDVKVAGKELGEDILTRAKADAKDARETASSEMEEVVKTFKTQAGEKISSTIGEVISGFLK